MTKEFKKPAALLLAVLLLFGVFTAAALPVFAEGESQEGGDKAKNEISAIADLNGKNIGVQTGVLYEDAIKDDIDGETWYYYKMPNDMIPALKANKINAYLIEEVGYYAQKYEHPELMRLEETAGRSDFSVIVGGGSDQQKLYGQIQEFIAAKRADGWLDQLYDYWVVNWNPATCKIENKPETSGENGTVSIAIEGGYEPFSFETNGEFSGFDVEFMMNFCAEYGYNWDFQAMEFDSIAPGCLSGKYNFGMNIVVDEERKEASLLSDPYYSCDTVFVVEDKTYVGTGFWAGLKHSFYKTFIYEARWKMFVEGVENTMLIALASVISGTILGFAAYMACRHGNKLANGIMNILDLFFEGIPTVVFLMLLAYVVLIKVDSNNIAAIVGFSLIFGCGVYDMLCVGCNAVPKGQTEASRALGYSDSQSFFRIILPQAAQHFMPIYKNNVISLLKETSVVGYIAALDLTKMGDLVRSRTYDAFFSLIAVTIIYFLLEAILIMVINRVQLHIDTKKRPKDKILKDIVEVE